MNIESLKTHVKLVVALWTYLLALAGSLVGGTIIPQLFDNGSAISMSGSYLLVWFPVCVALGPLVVSTWIGFLLIGPGSGLMGVAILLLGSAFQYALLIMAVRGQYRNRDSWRRWIGRGFVFVYSVLAVYALSVVVWIT